MSTNFFKGRKIGLGSGLRPILLGVLAVGGLLVGPQPAFATNSPGTCDGSAYDPDTCTGRTIGNKQVCAGDLFGPNLNCTANDVKIGHATNVRVPGTDIPITSCVRGSTVDFTADFKVSTNGGVTRYDIGLYFATDGDPNHDGAKTGTCSVSKETWANTSSSEFIQLDPIPDTCGDIDNAHKPQVVTLTLSALCQESPLFLNEDTGKCQATAPAPNAKRCMILPNIVSWRQTGANDLCDSPIDAFPGTTSKCKTDTTFGIPVTVEDAKVGVEKTANPTSLPEPGGWVTYTVKVTNTVSFSNVTITSIVDSIYGNLADASNSNVTDNSCPNLVGKALVPGGFETCTFKASMLGNAGYSETDVVEVCGDSSSGGGSGCGNDDATVTITDVTTLPSLTKTATSFTADVTYKVQVNNNSGFDTLTVNWLTDDKFGDITTVHAAGGGFEQVVSTDCNTVVGSTIDPGSHANCEFVGRFTNTSPHINTVTGDMTDDDGVNSKPADNATVTISIP